MNIPVRNIARKHTKTLHPDFEELYIAARKQEKKMYTDEQLQLLPDIDYVCYDGWKVKEQSSERLINYLEKKSKSLRILEVGCGNGRLSTKLSSIPGAKVIGVDINRVEIEQANRAFKKDNLEFFCDSFTDYTFDNEKFDVIVFSTSLQYFPSIVNV